MSATPLNKKVFSNLELKYLNNKTNGNRRGDFNNSFDYSFSDIDNTIPLNPLVDTPLKSFDESFYSVKGSPSRSFFSAGNQSQVLNNSFNYDESPNRTFDMGNTSFGRCNQLSPLDNLSFNMHNNFDRRGSTNSNSSFLMKPQEIPKRDFHMGTSSAVPTNNIPPFSPIQPKSPTPSTTFTPLAPSIFNKSSIPPPNFRAASAEPRLSPTGEWANPVVKKALKRMVNKELETKKILNNLFFVLVMKLFSSMVKTCLSFVEVSIEYFDNVSIFADYFMKFLYLLLGYNIIVGLKRVLSRPDKCLDLPLTSRQRELLGLPTVEQDYQPIRQESNIPPLEQQAQTALPRRIPDNDDMDDYTVPTTLTKYPKSNYFKSNFQTHSISSTPLHLKNFNESITTNDKKGSSLVVKNLIEDAEEQSSLQQKFSRRFNIDFEDVRLGEANILNNDLKINLGNSAFGRS